MCHKFSILDLVFSEMELGLQSHIMYSLFSPFIHFITCFNNLFFLHFITCFNNLFFTFYRCIGIFLMLAIVILAGCVAAFTVLLVDKDEPKSASKSNG